MRDKASLRPTTLVRHVILINRKAHKQHFKSRNANKTEKVKGEKN